MRRHRQTAATVLLLVLAASILAPALAAARDVPFRPGRALAWKPPTFDNADLHPRIPFLKPDRDWERMDVRVPKTGPARKPCVVAIYRGGYGDKVGGFVKDFRPLLDRGYVVAAPDYALGTIRPGLKTSRITTGTFEQGPAHPRITTEARLLAARVGKPFSTTFRADPAEAATWYAGGLMGERYRSYAGQRFNPPRLIPWMALDPKTGVLSGTPRVAGVYPVIVSCVNGAATGGRKPATMSADAVLVVVRVESGSKEGS